MGGTEHKSEHKKAVHAGERRQGESKGEKGENKRKRRS
jgi:hypothetical protein